MLRIVVFVLSALAILATAPGQNGSGSPDAEAATQQDPVEELKRKKAPFFQLISEVKDLYGQKENKDRLLALLDDRTTPHGVVVAIGSVLAENGARDRVDHFIGIVVEGKLDASRLDDVRAAVIYEFHKRSSVRPNLSRLLRAHMGDDERFGRCAAMFPFLVGKMKADRYPQEYRDRYEAASALVQFWTAQEASLSENDVEVLHATLEALTGGVIEHDDRNAWVQWLAPFNADESISLEDILRRSLDDSRKRHGELQTLYVARVAELVRAKAMMGESPGEFLKDPNAEIRAVTVREMKALSRTLPAERISPILEEINTLLSDEHRGGWDIILGAVDLAGAFGARATDADKARLSASLLALRTDEPGPLTMTLRALVEIGKIEKIDRVGEIYALAAKKKGSPWVEVRRLALKAAQVAPEGFELIMKGVADADASVRRDAAAALNTMRASIPADRRKECAELLARGAAAEKDAVARKRLMETLESVVAKDASLIAGDVLTKTLEIGEGPADNVRLSAVKVAVRALGRTDLAPELATRVTALVATALETPNHDDLARHTATFLVKHGGATGVPLVAKWFKAQRKMDAEWRGARDHLLGHYRKTSSAEGLWDIASDLAAQDGAPWKKEGATFGRAALTIVAAAPEHPLKGKLTEYRDTLCGWEVASGDVDMRKSAVGYLDSRLSKSPDLGSLLVLRARLHAAEGNPGVAESDLTRALGPGATTLGANDANMLWREVARLRWTLKKWSACVAAVDKAVAAAKWNEGVLMAARAVLLDPASDKTAANKGLERVAVDDPFRNSDTFLMVRAASWLYAGRADGHANAANDLDRVKQKEGELYEALRAELDAQPGLEAAVAAIDAGGDGAAAATKTLQAHPITAAAWLTRGLDELLRSGEAKGKQRLDALDTLFPEDKGLAGLRAAAGAATPATNGTLTRQIEEWARTRTLPQKIASAFLKGQ